MNRILIIFLLLLPNIAFPQEPLNQTDANGVRQGLWKKYHPNGKLWYEGRFADGKPLGEWKRYYGNGIQQAVLIYSENSDSAKATLFNEMGKPAGEGFFIHEKKAGEWRFFNNGILVSVEDFVNGERHGKVKKYYPTGELLEESEWENGKMDGKYAAFFKNGKPYFECSYKNNLRDGPCITYFESGARSLETFYKSGVLHGSWIRFDENGNIVYTLNYEMGNLLNPQVLDSLQQKDFDELEKNRGKFADPQDFLQNPEEYLIKSQKTVGM